MTPAISCTLGGLVQAVPALRSLCALTLSAKSAYHIKKLVSLVDVEILHFEREREGYIKALGAMREDGSFEVKQQIIVDGKNIDNPQFPLFMQQMNELVAVPVSITWSPVTLDMIGDEKVSAATLIALGPLFADVPDETSKSEGRAA